MPQQFTGGMLIMAELLIRVRHHCRTRPGMTFTDEDEFKVLGGFLDLFAQLFPDDAPPVAMLRVRDGDLAKLKEKWADVRVSNRMKWDTRGWTWADVPIDGSVPESVLLQLIDRSYQIVVDENDEGLAYRLELISRGLPPRELLAELIDQAGLTARRGEIEALIEPALLLRTQSTAEAELPLGSSKIGGRPDLPAGVAWPRHKSSGKPLAFLAQMDLAAAAQAGPLDGLPSRGLLHVFSVYGWQAEGEWDPHLPKGRPTADWTQILYHARPGPLTRHEAPADVNAFPSAAVEFVPVLSLPNDPSEPKRQKLGLDEDEQDRFDELHGTFDEITMYTLGDPPHHQLLGFAKYEQEFIDVVAEQNLRLVFQLASDDNAGMMWGDDGYLYFFAKPAAIQKCDFAKIVTEYQSG